MTRARRSALLVIPVLLAGWFLAWPQYLFAAQRRMVAVAAAQGWTITPAGHAAWPWLGVFDLGPTTFATERLVWTAGRVRLVPGWAGGHWIADGPHRAGWGALGPVEFTGTIRVEVRPTMAVSSRDVRIEAGATRTALRWDPAVLDGGTLTLSGLGTLPNPAWAPGLGQAVGAILALLTQPDGSVMVPLRRQGSALVIAGFPVLPWPAESH